MHRKTVGLILSTALMMPATLWADSAQVTDVVDGDTIIIDGGARVQLIGVDALGHSWGLKKSRRLAERSTAFASHFLKGKTVRMERDPANELNKHKDKWGRNLAYIYLGDVLFNLAIIEQGYASAYTKYSFDRRERFQAAEKQARAEARGLWAWLKDGKHAEHAHGNREILVGDRDSRVYHKASCLLVKNIPEEDRVRFHEEIEAKKSGYKPGRWCIPILMKRF